MSVINRNGKTFDSGDVVIALFGSIDWEITEISYGNKQAHQANYSLGSNKPTSYSAGKIEYESSLTMRLPSASRIEKSAGGDLLNVKPFPINITFLNDDNEIINDTVYAKFTGNKREVGGDVDLKSQFELFVLDIDFNNANI
jgi:hypothetical protein